MCWGLCCFQCTPTTSRKEWLRKCACSLTTVLFTVKYILPLTISHSCLTWTDFNVSKCAVLSVTTKRNISAYDYFMGSQQIPWTDNQLGLPGGYHQHKTIVATTYQQCAEKSKQDTWLTQKNTACGVTTSETNGIRGTRAAKARVCQVRLGTSHKDRHSDDRARVQRSAARFLNGECRRTSCVSDMCINLMWNSLYTRRRIRETTFFF